MAYLNVPDRDRDKGSSPAESIASSATDLSALPMNLGQRRDEPTVSTNCCDSIASVTETLTTYC